MSERLRVELSVTRSGGGEPRSVVLTAPDDVTAGVALDRLGAHLGLGAGAGAVQGRSLISGQWIDRNRPLREVGLLRGERLSLSVGMTPESPPQPLRRWPDAPAGNRDGRVAVNRPPRPVTPEPTDSVRLPRKQMVRRPRRFPLGAILIPVAIGVLLVLVTRRWEIALFSLFSPVMILWNHVEEKRAAADEVREYGRTYDEAVAAAVGRVRTLSADWAAWQHRAHPAPAELVETVRTLGSRLWERQSRDPDFLHVRLGLGTRRAPVEVASDGDDRSAVDKAERMAVVDAVPVTVDLFEAGLLAVVADPDHLERVAGWIAAQLAALHSPADVTLAAALADEDTRAWWQWLPHLADGLFRAHPLAGDGGAADALLTEIADLGRRRTEARETRRRVDPGPTLVVFIDDRLRPDPALVHAALGYGDVGILVVWIGTHDRAVPGVAPFLLTVDAGATTATLIDHRGGATMRLSPEWLSRTSLSQLSDWLAPVRDAADARRTKTIPERVPLDDLIPDITSPSALRRNWTAAGSEDLTARIGVSADGPVHLELGAHGAHVLVGGTTGSGKSELLQTMVAATAAAYPPSRVGFLLVDYKGGAAFKDAMRLPHCVGVVTDLDAHLTRRVLQALEAEIKRREHLLAKAGARDLLELRRIAPSTAPGELVVVVDEFATLSKEIPEFVEGVVDIAARGRSLGLRLVLATQRPAGVVNDRIRANVGARLALRVNDEADSMDVIDTRQAAHIPRTLPGRAFLRVHRDLVEFQSAFVGGPAKPSADDAVQVTDLHGAPRPTPTSGRTLLESVVEAANQAVRFGAWTPPHVPWLPPLPPVITRAELAAGVASEPPPGTVLFAKADLPAKQEQRAVAFDLQRHQNLLVFGTSRSGKTTTLRTIALGLIATHAPDLVQIYALDFSGQGLRVLEAAPHCPAAVTADDPGRIARVLRRLTREAEDRRRLMAAAGVSTFAALADAATVPRIVVLLDGYAGAAAALERIDGGRMLERLERLIVDGPSVGLHFLITADRRAAVPSALTSVITSRLVLRMADRDDYTLLGVDPALSRHAKPVPGRGFLQATAEVQVAVQASDDPHAEDAAVAEVVEAAEVAWRHRAVPKLGRMPAEVAAADLPVPSRPLALPVGIADTDLGPALVDLEADHVLVAGPPRSGRSTALYTLAVAARRAPQPAAVALFTARRSPLTDLDGWDVGPVDAGDPARLAAAVEEVGRLLDSGRVVLCFCDDIDALPDAASTTLEALARRGRDDAVRFIAATDNRWALRAYSGLAPELRRSKHGLLLAPDVDLDGDLVGVRLRAPVEPLGVPGRGFLVRSGIAELVQVARPA